MDTAEADYDELVVNDQGQPGCTVTPSLKRKPGATTLLCLVHTIQEKMLTKIVNYLWVKILHGQILTIVYVLEKLRENLNFFRQTDTSCVKCKQKLRAFKTNRKSADSQVDFWTKSSKLNFSLENIGNCRKNLVAFDPQGD